VGTVRGIVDEPQAFPVRDVVRFSRACVVRWLNLSHGFFVAECFRWFPCFDRLIMRRSLVGVVRIMIGLDGTGNVSFEFELRSLH
jgi:hypothetical protein